MDDRFMKERPVFPLLISMALPMVISMLVNSLYNIVDSWFISRISEDAITALSLVFPIQNLINAVTIGFGIGVNAVIAYHLGANELERADRAASQGLTLSLIHGLILAAGCIFLMPRFLPLYSDSQVVVDLGVRYATVAFAFAPVISLGMFYEKLFQAVGSMRLTMIAMLCGCVANIILDPMMIYGIGPFPEMGIEGAALATGIGQTLSLVIYLVAYKKRPLRLHVRRKFLRPEGKMARRLYAVGVPAALNLALPSILISALNGILAAFGQAYILALGVYYKLQTFLYLTANGIVQGMRPLIGYNYGAGEHARVKRIYDLVLLMSAVIMVVGTALFLAAPQWLMGLFAEDPATIEAGATALRIISAGFIVSAVSVTSSGALEGLGMGTPSLIISLFRYTVVIIPVAFILSRFFGVYGVWNALWISEVVAAIISVIVYRRCVTAKATVPSET